MTVVSPNESLFRDLAEGRLQPDQFRTLEARLSEDADLRQEYLRFMNIEATLYEECGRWNKPVAAAGRFSGPQILISTLAAAVILLLAALSGMLLNLRQAEMTSPPAASVFVASGLRGLRDAAVVTLSSHDSKRDDETPLLPGTRLKPGVVRLDAGILQLELLCGVRLALEGPAELHILNDHEAMLVSGVASVRVPETAMGFVLNGPRAAIVDMGSDDSGVHTEFAMVVSETESDVHVFRGRIELSLLGDDGNTLLSERAGESVTLRIASDRDLIEPIREFRRAVPVVAPPEISRLNVPRRYISMVRDQNPVVYWRFEGLDENGRISNEMSDLYAGEIFQPEGGDAVILDNGQVQFLKSDSPRTIRTVSPLPELNARDYTIEMWVNPEDLSWSTLLSVSPDGDPRPARHLNVIETAHGSSMVHTPGSFRFLHRAPPKNSGGINAFSDGGCSPGLWHHLVAVRTADEIRLYLNGKLAKQRICSSVADNDAYHLFLGQLRMIPQESERELGENYDRQFVGQIDEVVVYGHELTDQQISDHYWTVVRSNPSVAPLNTEELAFVRLGTKGIFE